jgi:hypothetical protein
VAETLVCRIEALTATERRRQAFLAQELKDSLEDVEELEDGFAVRFPARPMLFLRLSEWIELERACCPFLRLGVRFENPGKRIRLELRGPAGVKEFLESELRIPRPTR